jgi:CRP/FNR family transcriptional regulator
MPGEVIGTDGIGNDSHGCQAVALEDTEVCTLPFERIEALGRQNVRFQHNLHRLLSREIGRERTVMMLLGTMHAEQRLAAFLLDLSQRYGARLFLIRVRTTDDARGNWQLPGTEAETVSRLFRVFSAGPRAVRTCR